MTSRSQLYEFRSDEDEFVIFARTPLRARAMFEAVESPDVVMPPGWGGMEIEAWRRWGTREQIEQVCAGGWEGLGVPFSDREIWTVLPMPKGSW